MILDEIVSHKRRQELPRLAAVDRSVLADLPPTRGFAAALRRDQGPIRLIAESKKGSPSKGIFREHYDPVANAFAYQLGGASAISVLTDERFFFGHLDHLVAVRGAVGLPLLRKDFLVDERQVAEARLAGADAILLIVACLEDGQLRDLGGFADELGLDVLVEVHDADEATRAVALGFTLVGVNNRDLKTFHTDLETTFALVPGLQGEGRVVVAESGIACRDDCARLEATGVDAALVGEALMRADDPTSVIHALRGTIARGVTG